MNVKKYISSIIAGAIFLTGFTGCQNDNAFLEEKSYALNTFNYYKAAVDIEKALNYGYTNVQYLLMTLNVNHYWMQWMT